MAKKKRSPFKTGRADVKAGSGGQFVGIKPNESIQFAPLVGLDELVYADMHEHWDIRPAAYYPCIGRDCPGCQLDNEPRFKGYLPILKKDGDVAIYPFTVSVYSQLENLEDALEGETLKGFVIKVGRKGSGMATRYTVTGLGKRIKTDGVEIPDFIDSLGPTTREGILQLLDDRGVNINPILKDGDDIDSDNTDIGVDTSDDEEASAWEEV